YIDNAYLPESVRQIMLDNNLTQFTLSKMGSFDQDHDISGNARNVNVFTQWQYSFSFDYRLPVLEWDLSGSWQRGESKRNSQAIERVRNDRMFLAMDAVRDANGAIVCRVQLFNPTREQLAESVAGRISPVPLNYYLPLDAPGNCQPLKSPIGLDNTIEDCVPFNIMGSGNISAEAIDYIGTPKIQHAYVNQDFAELLLTGDLYQGWGYGAVSFAAGLTWRDQSFIDTAGPISVVELGPPVNVPSLGIQGFPPMITGGSANLHAFSTVPFLGGQTNVWEWFSELNIPIWEGSLIGSQEQRLGASLAFRRSNYERSGAVDSWKVGIDFQVINDLRLRLTSSQDVREPTFGELFDAQGGGGNVLDPRYDNASFPITRTAGGNPDLAPEVAKTMVAGFVYEPSFAAWVEGLQLSLDWYDVEIEGAVSSLGVQRIVDECEINGNATLCRQIIRDPTTGFITRVLDTFLNVDQAKVEGVDLELSYRAEPDLFGDELETFSLRALGGYIMERSDTPLGGVPFDQAGARGTPQITTTITGTYSVGPWSAQLAARYYDSVLYNARWVEGVDVDDNTIPSMTWINARLGYESELSSGASWSVNFNITNLFNREPPIVPGFNSRGGTQTVDNNYDVFGRRYNLSANYKF
ncbi:MAG: TonB-dependent receptor, partial [Pseudomonadales bacterium]|nr:TonB-dependent receptor [Pseudomonadales bacterium]